ncbi:polyphosphate polymerase domain-containing protein [Oceanirhabdus seepicola]|uniref:Polyphosphate polymerase domain-containing protein n=1 Tax=Oceanirhabdus seepicola TaxID=2828781 RepID=A0A9J6P1C9_9CLOT|nr:polyphosphate polymerase domain-containing protein [Oceanirhabdus seepicola]
MIVNRREIKYVISEYDYFNFNNVFKNILIEDSNNKNFGYSVRSLYFDSINNCDFYSKMYGEEVRKKIRLRIYDTNAEVVKLEIKRKINVDQIKETTEITREDAIRLINKEYQVLLKYNNSTAQTAYNIMTLGQYQPVVLIEYNRRAYLHTENNIRVTLDSDIRANETNFDLFSNAIPMIPVFNHYHAILEVKYDGELFCWITQIMQSKDGVNQSLSKYCTSRKFFDNYLS